MGVTGITLTSAEALGVLGEYDHRLSLSSDEEYTIIYGPNGVGKTKFLEIIHAMCRVDGGTLSRLPFDSAQLVFSDGTLLTVGATPEDNPSAERRRSRRRLTFTLKRPSSEPVDWNWAGDDSFEWLMENTSWRPYENDLWEDFRDGEVISLSELEDRFPEFKEREDRLPPVFRGFRRVMKSYLIETQRLRIENVSEGSPRPFGSRPAPRRKHTSKIVDHAVKMRGFLGGAQAEHSTITQQLDRTFPNRVLEGSMTAWDVDQVRQRYEEQNAFRSRLGRVASVDLAEELSLPDRDLEGWEVRLLTQYLDDAVQKLAPFETLLQKIELFEAIVNTRLLRKKLRVTAKDGLLVQHDPKGHAIDLNSLSSGEQHEIILMFDLLFNVPEGALVLIDEPEISLHVVWQMAFIPDVQRIAEIAGFRFVVATHSPQIINGAWDKAIPLGPEEVPFL